jgi:Fur family transcriptional regulator, zinc uptake regulator
VCERQLCEININKTRDLMMLFFNIFSFKHSQEVLYYNITYLSSTTSERLSKNKVLSPFKPAIHKHQDCLESAIEAAKRQCDASGQRFTQLRQRVLELVWQNHEPVKAYDILDELKQDSVSSAPPTVYRALDFLQEQGLVHKIESLNAYVGCGNPRETHQSQFFICRDCGSVAELDDADIRNLIQKKAKRFGFMIDGEMVEIKGHCQECRDTGK